MILTLAFALSVLCAGFAVLRALGLAKGLAGLGLAPATGIAVLAVIESWGVLTGVPPIVRGAAYYAVVVVGLGLAVRDRESIAAALGQIVRREPAATVTLIAALAVPLVVMAVAFDGAVVPLSPHDGAAHTEAVQAFRQGQPWSAWYPPGTAAIFAGFLEPLAWVDSAEGAFDLGMSLPPLAALSAFGLGMSVWRDVRIAAIGALLLGFTYLYPFFPQVWSGWPLAMSLILVMGVWSIGLEYLNWPTLRWAIASGLGLGATVLVHGSEVYTLLIVLPVVLIGAMRRVAWRPLGVAVAIMALVATASAVGYLPNLARWAGSGGAYAAALTDAPTPPPEPGAGVTLSPLPALFAVFALNALGIDLPIRVMLLAIGVGCAFRRQIGRSVAVVGLIFGGIALTMTLLNGASAVRQFYAVTYPWGMHYRLLMIVTLAQVMLAGAGGGALLGWLNRWTAAPGVSRRLMRRSARLLVVTWALLASWAMTVYVAYPARLVLGYDAADDGAAMDWLRAHAAPGDVVANDGYSDAGIWAPYKADVPILLPRWTLLSETEIADRNLVIDNITRLDTASDANAAACREHVRWVYYGVRTSAWDKRRFPQLEELRASAPLMEVFSHGGSAVFEARLNCPAT